VATDKRFAALLRTAVAKSDRPVIMQKQTVHLCLGPEAPPAREYEQAAPEQVAHHGGKTGFISEAGYCLATLVETPSATEVTAVLLGAPSNGSGSRGEKVLDWTFRLRTAAEERGPRER